MPSADYDAIMKALDEYEKKPATTPSAPQLEPAPPATDTKQLQRPGGSSGSSRSSGARKKTPAPPVEVEPEIDIGALPPGAFLPEAPEVFARRKDSQLDMLRSSAVVTPKTQLARNILGGVKAYPETDVFKAQQEFFGGDVERNAQVDDPAVLAQTVESRRAYDASVYDKAKALAQIRRLFPDLTPAQYKDMLIRHSAGIPFQQEDLPFYKASPENQALVQASLDVLTAASPDWPEPQWTPVPWSKVASDVKRSVSELLEDYLNTSNGAPMPPTQAPDESAPVPSLYKPRRPVYGPPVPRGYRPVDPFAPTVITIPSKSE